MITHTRSSLVRCALAMACTLASTVAIVAADQPPATGTAGISDVIAQSSWTSKGLCVQIGCGDGALTSAIATGGRWVVQALDPDPRRVDAARAAVLAKGIYGQASVETGGFERLPYEDNLVDVVVIEDPATALKQKLALAEVARILTPGGVALFGGATKEAQAKLEALGFQMVVPPTGDRAWLALRKAKNPQMDEWPQWRHDAGGSNVSKDALYGIGQQFRWVAEPFNGTATPRDTGGFRAAGNRIIYMIKGWAEQGKDVTYWLICRNAFNGTLLWRREIPTSPLFAPRCHGYSNCPDWDARIAAAGVTKAPPSYRISWDWMDVPKIPPMRCVAIWKDRIFMNWGTSWTCLDAATGRTIGTLAGYAEPKQQQDPLNIVSEGQLLVSDGVVLACESPFSDIKAWDAQTLAPLWTRPGIKTPIASREQICPTVIAGGGLAFVRDENAAFVALNVRSGHEVWRVAVDKLPKGVDGKCRLLQFSDGRLFAAKRGAELNNKGPSDPAVVYALSAADGKLLWSYTCPTPPPANNWGMPTVLAYADEIWMAAGERFDALDPATGAVKRTFNNDRWRTYRGCTPPNGTTNFFLYGKENIHVDRTTLKWSEMSGIRTPCCYTESGQQVPAYGLGYYMPDECKCGGVTYRGMMAVSHSPTTIPQALADPARLVKGAQPAPPTATPALDDWPTYRRDERRSNLTAAAGPAGLTCAWQTRVGTGCLSQATIAGGRAYVADIDGYQVVALDAASGQIAWRFVTSGRMDVPPTLYAGLCLAADHAGWVYALEAATGRLIWKYRVAPLDYQMAFCGRFASPWPVIGGVLVHEGKAMVTAGRTSMMDGGVLDCALNPASGAVLWENLLVPPQNQSQQSKKEPPNNPAADLLVADVQGVYLNGYGIDMKTGGLTATQTPDGILRATRGVMHQFLWDIEPFMQRRSFITDGRIFPDKSCAVAANGPNLAFTDRTSYFGDFDPGKTGVGFLVRAIGAATWSAKLDGQHGAALIVAGPYLFMATLPADRDPAQKSQLLRLSAADGKVIASVPLDAAPALDGLSTSGGRLFLTTQDGRILCYK